MLQPYLEPPPVRSRRRWGIVGYLVILGIVLALTALIWSGFQNEFEQRDEAGMRNLNANGGILP